MTFKALHTPLHEHIVAGRLIRAMAAHSPLSALLVEEAGFEAIWASGFELSALYGLADVSLISMSEHVAMVRAMSARCALPIIADIDTGYGNAISVIHTVQCYESAGAAAVVMEDKHFPKVSSLVDGGRQELVRVEEFVGKTAAALHARHSQQFLVIARTEALIAGAGLEDALQRGRAYADAGADMILVHSKQGTPTEIERFVDAWDRDIPLAVVPTTYPQFDEAKARELKKIHVVIYGNHAIRASIRAMRDVFREIAATGGASAVQSKIASVEDVFVLQQMDRIRAEEGLFLR